MAYTTIDDPSAHFQIETWTGTSSTDTITFSGNSDLQLDWLWSKSTDNGHSHALMDTNRITSGDYLPLFADTTDVEQTAYDSELQSITSDGFTVGTQPHAGGDGKSYIGYAWKANGGSLTNVSATGTAHESTMAGSYQANTTAGFSIVTFSTGSEDLGDKLITHGLGKKPEMIMVKERDGSTDWLVHHVQANTNDSKYLKLNSSSAVSTTSSRNSFDTSNITTTQFAADHSNILNDNKTYVAYCFAPIKGYSRFGIYRGNGSADGTFVFTGFKPAFLMFKALSGSENWGLFDNKRTTQSGNPRDIYFTPSTDSANSSESDSVDFLSNGFKWRIDSGFRNGDGVDFIYMAFAESPFTSSEGVPTTAE